jgi:hypothetical protein
MTKMRFIIPISLFLFFLSPDVSGQWLVLSKGNRKHNVYLGSKYIISLKDNSTFKGEIDSINSKSIMLNTKDFGVVTVNIDKIKMLKTRRHIWYIGAWASLIQVTLKYDLDKWKYHYSPRVNK